MAFMDDHFLLQTRTAQRLYHEYAAGEPIFDYHCHLSPKDIAENRRFANLFEIWLEGDHYKWRAMRANGIDERYVTGDADPYLKFVAWARTVPQTLRNPLYHWTHLELRRYFGITDLLDENTAPTVWKLANAALGRPEMSVHGILRKFGVSVVCTTDDPIDSLEYHKKIAASDLETRVYPAFRPDAALRTKDAKSWNAWLDALAGAAGVKIANLSDLLDAIKRRHDYFHAQGCRLSDHGLDHCYAEPCTEAEAAALFTKARGGADLDETGFLKFASFLMLFFGRLDAKKGWTKQLHLGAMRNVNTRMMQKLGRDTGWDSIGDWPQMTPLAGYLDQLEREDSLPKMVLYNLNPADNFALATMIGNFQDGRTPGKMQFGSGWWYLDQKEAIEWQLNALSNVGLLSRFVGMLTDSRSFMSFPRHEYFRRVLCNLLGSEMEAGLLPSDEQLVGNMVHNICFQNAAQYFGMPTAETAAPVAVGETK
jgi:glucuronate isomerase